MMWRLNNFLAVLFLITSALYFVGGPVLVWWNKPRFKAIPLQQVETIRRQCFAHQLGVSTVHDPDTGAVIAISCYDPQEALRKWRSRT